MIPLVSFLIPAYDAERYLAETLRSALAQSWPRKEIIVVNDGSHDGTLAVARSFSSTEVKVITQENRGQSASENRAFAESQGDFIVHLDSDDVISSNKTEVQIRRLLEAEPGSVAFCKWGRFYDVPESARFVPEPFWRDIEPIDFHVEMWDRCSMIQGGCYLIPRALMERAGAWNETLSLINDFDFFPRVLLLASKLLFCPEAELYYRSGRPDALSGSKSPTAWDSAFRSLCLGTARLLAAEDSQRTRRACAQEFQSFIYAAYPDVPELMKRAKEEVRKLGGSDLRCPCGPKFRLVSRIIGWRLAKRLQRFQHRWFFRMAAKAR
jgi:glycosyltransferase involved in cell wall biosynthesis